MGAVLSIRWRRLEPWPADLDGSARRGFRIVALTPRRTPRRSTHIRSTRASRVMVVVGAEGRGLSEAVLDGADDRVRIPIASGRIH